MTEEEALWRGVEAAGQSDAGLSALADWYGERVGQVEDARVLEFGLRWAVATGRRPHLFDTWTRGRDTYFRGEGYEPRGNQPHRRTQTWAWLGHPGTRPSHDYYERRYAAMRELGPEAVVPTWLFRLADADEGESRTLLWCGDLYVAYGWVGFRVAAAADGLGMAHARPERGVNG